MLLISSRKTQHLLQGHPSLVSEGRSARSHRSSRAVGELSRRDRGGGAHTGRAQEKQRWPEAVRCHPDVQDAGSTSAQQSVGRAGGISGARPAVVLALSGARDRGQHSGRHDALAVPREAGQGRADRTAV